MRRAIEATKKRISDLKNKPIISPFFSLIHYFEKSDHSQIERRETFFESLKLSAMVFMANIFTLILFFIAARKLGVIEYSELGVLFSIFFMFAAATNLLNIVIIKYLSYFIAKTQYDKISRFCYVYVRVTLLIGLVVLLILSLLSSLIAGALKLTPTHIIVLGVLIWAFSVWNAFMGILNGLQYFTLLGLNRIFQAFFSTLFSLIFLFMGFKSVGVMIGMVVGTVIAIPFGFYSARDIFFIKPHKIGKMSFFRYLVPSTLVVLCVGVILNIDLPLVRHYLSAFESGNYAAVSLLSSTVFSFSMVASMVMFPKVAQLASNGSETQFLFKRAMKYVFYMCFGATLLFFVFSKLIVGVVFGSEFRISQYVGVYALAMSIWAISNVLIMYNLALERRVLLYVVPIAAIIEFFLLMVINANIWSIIVLLVVFHMLLFSVLAKFSEAQLSFLDKMDLKAGIRGFLKRFI